MKEKSAFFAHLSSSVATVKRGRAPREVDYRWLVHGYVSFKNGTSINSPLRKKNMVMGDNTFQNEWDD